MAGVTLNMRLSAHRLFQAMSALPRRLSWLSGKLRLLMSQVFAASVRGLVVVAVILAVAAASGGRAEKAGDDLQVTLPLLAWGCAAANGDGLEYLGRYVGMFLVAHGIKRASGGADYNQRPNGGAQGMPSAHTSTAALGASRLAGDCLAGNPIVQIIAVLSAGFVGTSRVDAGAHTIWQVLGGAILGLLCDRAFGKTSAARIWLAERIRFTRQKGRGSAESPGRPGPQKSTGGRIAQLAGRFVRVFSARPV